MKRPNKARRVVSTEDCGFGTQLKPQIRRDRRGFRGRSLSQERDLIQLLFRPEPEPECPVSLPGVDTVDSLVASKARIIKLFRCRVCMGLARQDADNPNSRRCRACAEGKDGVKVSANTGSARRAA